MVKPFILSLAMLVFTILPSIAQDAVFSQYYASSLYLNPAFAGMENKVTFSSNYRTQWKSILSSPYTTSQVSLIAPISIKKISDKHLGGIGLSFYNNKAGDGNLVTTGVNLSIGYNVHLSSLHYLSFGLQGGFVQKSINLDKLQWGSQYNPFIGGYDPGITVNPNDIASNRMFADFSGGLMYYFNPERDYEEKGFSLYAGIAGYHLSQPNESMLNSLKNTLPILIKSHAGVEWNFSKKFNFSPNVLVAMQNGLTQINTGAYLTYLFGSGDSKITPSFILLGGWYRFKDSYIGSLGIGNNSYTLGFSYDLNNSSLRYNTQGKGAYEVSLKIQLGTTKKVKIYNPLI